MKRLLLYLFLMMASVSSFADSGSTQTPPPSNGTGVLNLIRKDPDIKRSPTRCVLNLFYENGILTLMSESYEGEFSLSFTDIETGESYEVPSISVGDTVSFIIPCGEYEVYAIGPDGLILGGFMQVY